MKYKATKKKKKTIVPPLNKTEADKVLSEYAKNHAKREAINAEMDEKITAIREKYSDKLDEVNENVTTNFDKLQVYYENHPEHFEKKKSIDTAHGQIGFRTGMPKLKAKKGFTWAAVLSLLKKHKAHQYIRVKEEAAKDLLIANRNDGETITLLDNVGVDVIQDDTFFIDLKKEEVQN